jgi:hypothetical protein
VRRASRDEILVSCGFRAESLLSPLRTLAFLQPAACGRATFGRIRVSANLTDGMALGRIVRQLDRVERGRSEESDVTN